MLEPILHLSQHHLFEITKLCVEALTPLIVLILGIRFNRGQWRNQKLIERRLQIYDQLIPMINDLYCYFHFIGRWKEFTPEEIISKKRDADRIMKMNTALFGKGVSKSYDILMDTFFETYLGITANPKLRTDPSSYKLLPHWHYHYSDLFSEPQGRMQDGDFFFRYHKFLDQFARTLGMKTFPTFKLYLKYYKWHYTKRLMAVVEKARSN